MLPEYRLAAFVCFHPLPDGGALLMHPLRAMRHTIDEAAFSTVKLVRERGRASLDEVVAHLVASGTDREEIRSAWTQLVDLSYLVPEGTDDLAQWLPAATTRSARDDAHQYLHSPLPDSNVLRSAVERRAGYEHEGVEPLPIVFLGACNVRYVIPAISAMSPSYGFSIASQVGYPNNTELIEEHDPRMVVLNPHIELVLAPLFERFSERTSAERRERLESYKEFVRSVVQAVRKASAGRLLVVHGFAAPIASPFGRAGFREELDVCDVATEINNITRQLLSDDPDAMFLDEERLLGAAGKRILQDDWIREFRHHETSEDVLEELGILPEAHRRAEIMAQEYLDCYSVWRGRAAIKLVVVDLDNTLWPGVVGESAHEPPFDHNWWRENLAALPNARSLHPDVLRGFHEALLMLRGRGVLLATCSKNTEADTRAHWDKMAASLRGFIRPEDFVIHRINWNRKPDNIREILAATGVAESACAFIDDSVHEREEVRQAFPRMRIVTDEPWMLRWRLLEDPAFQGSFITEESKKRSTSMRSKLERDAAARSMMSASTDPRHFLRSLGVEIAVNRLRPGMPLARAAELLGRTNQFNTTLIRRTAAEIESILEAGGAVYTANVRDRFGDHGLVATCIVVDRVVVNFAMSCRAIGIDPAAPFLVTVVTDLGDASLPLVGRWVEGPRNQPCRKLFADAGFAAVAPGEYRLEALSALAPVDRELYAVTVS